LAAAALGADVLEVHVTLSREMFGPDVPVSVTTGELRQLVEGIRFIELMNANPVNKDEMANELKPMRDLFTKSIVATVDLDAGTILREHHLKLKKPGLGLPATKMPEIIGTRLRRTIKANEFLRSDDIEVIG
jgi:N-acetylneuraminate synthase